jgi:hypothetical protein
MKSKFASQLNVFRRRLLLLGTLSVLMGCRTHSWINSPGTSDYNQSQKVAKRPHCRDVRPAECKEKLELFVHFEQKRNIKNIYKDGVFQSDMPEEFRAENGRSFTLPYFMINSKSQFFSVQSMDERIPAFIADHHYVKDSNGGTLFKFPVHPIAVEYYREALKGTEYTFVPAEKSEFLVTATASERTLVRNLEDREPGGSYMIKVSLPIEINNRSRELYPTELKRGLWFSKRLTDDFSDALESFFFFLEPYGAYPRSSDGRALGATVFRTFPEEFYESGTRTIPLFSYLAEDETGKPLFFKSIPAAATKQSETDIWNWYVVTILRKFLDRIKAVSYEMGIGLQLHSQNTLIELDESLSKPTGRFGYRDLGGAFYDLPGALVLDKRLPDLSSVRDIQRETGLAYFKGSSLLDWTLFFFKKQISDLFIIQMSSHGLATKKTRDYWKALSWKLAVDDYRGSYSAQWRNAAPGLLPVSKLPKTYYSFSLYPEDAEPPSLDHLKWYQRDRFYLGVDEALNRVTALGLPLNSGG